MAEVAEKTMVEEMIEYSPFARKFEKTDWYGWAGASKLPDNSGPFIYEDKIYSILYGGPADGYIEDGSNVDCDIQVCYEDAEDDTEIHCWDRPMWNYEENKVAYTKLFLMIVEWFQDKRMTREECDSILKVLGFNKIL